MAEITLNKDQTHAFESLQAFAASNNKILAIQGYAGTGKTFLITHFIEEHLKKHRHDNIVFSAPTNKAVAELMKKSSEDLRKKVGFSTIHQLLSIKAVIEDGQEIFKVVSKSNGIDINSYDLVIVDEISMVSETLFNHIIEALEKSKRLKLVLMGDPAQIPPVGEVDCVPFLYPERYNIEIIKLNQIMRQADGNPIIQASMDLRDQLNNGFFDFETYCDQDKLIFYNNYEERERQLLKDYINSVYSGELIRQDSSYCKVITYRNIQVFNWNNLIRSIYHNREIKDLPQLLVGDQLVTNNPVFDGEQIVLNTSTDLVVLKMEEDKKKVSFNIPSVFRYYKCLVSYYDYIANQTLKTRVDILMEEELIRYKKLLEMLSEKAKKADNPKKVWLDFFKVQKEFADVSYGFAITAHKSQGSTYENTIVDVNDIMMNGNVVERNRILYTSLTRASNTCRLIVKKTKF